MAQFDISVEEILHSLGEFERRELFEELSDEFESAEGPRLKGKKRSLTPTESDFQEVLLELWHNRSRLTPEQIDRIVKILAEPQI
jgi:hypothetical protein